MTNDTGRESVNVNEALSSPEKEKWIDVMEREMHLIKTNKVWELVKPSAGKKTTGCTTNGSLSANLMLMDP